MRIHFDDATRTREARQAPISPSTYESVSRCDQVVGALVAALEASGRAAETLVFVTTDHAMPFPGAGVVFR